MTMTIRQAAKVLLRYPNQTRERPNTCYGGTSNVYECALNVGSQLRACRCELAAAIKVIEPDEDEA